MKSPREELWLRQLAEIALLFSSALPVAAFAQTILPPVTIVGQRDPYSGCSDATTGKSVACSTMSGGSGPWSGAGLTQSFAKIPPPSEKNAPSDDCRTSPKTHHPVIVATGEKVQEETDFTDFSLGGLSIKRTYRSSMDRVMGAENDNSMFGPHWYNSLQYPKMVVPPSCETYTGWSYLGCMPDWVRLSTTDGATHLYTLYRLPDYFPPGGSGEGLLGRLHATAPGIWTVTIGDKRYIYNRTTKNLESVYQRGNKLYTYTYQDDKLISITSLYGKTVTFVWTGARVTEITDPDGQVWRYGYDAAGNLTSASGPSNVPGTRQYHYEDAADSALLTGISIDGVRSTRYAYDSSKRVTRSGFENSDAFEEFVYGNNYTQVTDEKGQPTQFNFQQVNDFKRLTSVSRAGTSTCGVTASFQTYDANGNLAGSTDWNGVRTEYIYSGDGQLSSETVAAGTPQASKRTFTWMEGKLATTTAYDTAGIAYLRSTDDYTNGLLSRHSVTELAGMTSRQTDTSYQFHPSGAISRIIWSQSLPNGAAISTNEYDQAGNLTQSINPLGYPVQLTDFTGLGQPRQTFDQNGVASSYSYDGRGRILSQSTALSGGVRYFGYTYTGAGDVASITDPNNQVTLFSYNSAGRLIRATNSLQQSVTYNKDVVNRLSSTSSVREIPTMSGSTVSANVAGEFVSSIQYDSLGRVRNELHSAGRMTTYSYDGIGNVTQTVDAAGRATRYEYDRLNRMVRQISADNSVTEMGYDSRGNLSYVQDNRSLRTTYAYNAFGDRISMVSPDSGATTFAYDAAGRITSSTKANGKSFIYSVDILGRVLTRSSGPLVESFFYDEGEYGRGRLSRFTDATGETVYNYNALGQVIKQLNTVSDRSFTTSWSYDSIGKLTSMSYPTGIILNYSYDVVGRLAAIKTSSAIRTH